jgi:hypothetical protein
MSKKLTVQQISRVEPIYTPKQLEKLFEKTPDRFIYSRPAKGGGKWSFVKTSYVRKVLDSVFGFDWDFTIETSVSEAHEVAKSTGFCLVKGTLTVRTAGKEIKKTHFGRKEVTFKKDSTDLLDIGNDLKAAASDCLKKCASLLGIASDIYEADDFLEIEVVQPETVEELAKRKESERVKKHIESAVKESDLTVVSELVNEYGLKEQYEEKLKELNQSND